MLEPPAKAYNQSYQLAQKLYNREQQLVNLLYGGQKLRTILGKRRVYFGNRNPALSNGGFKTKISFHSRDDLMFKVPTLQWK